MAATLSPPTPPAPHVPHEDHRRRHLLRLLGGRPSSHLLRSIHALALRLDILSDPDASRRLLTAACRSAHLDYTIKVFDQILHPDLYSWSVLLCACAYSQDDGPALALRLLARLLRDGRPSPFLLRGIHALALRLGLLPDPDASRGLLIAACRSAHLGYTLKVFDQIPQPDLRSWNILLRACAYSPGDGPTIALRLLVRLLHEDHLFPDCFTYTPAFKAASALRDGRVGRALHGLVAKSPCSVQTDAFLLTSVLHMYASCGELDSACGIFARMPRRDVVSWTTLIHALADAGRCAEAVEAFRTMEDEEEQVKPNKLTMVGLLNACEKMGDLDQGKSFHRYLESRGIEQDVILRNALLKMYVKCGSLQDARDVFDKMPERNVVSWNTLIHGLVDAGRCAEAVETFRTMKDPNEVTMVGLFNACGKMGDLDQGKTFHRYLESRGIGKNLTLGNALLIMYVKCGSLQDARDVFDGMPERDEFSWMTMVAGYARSGDYYAARQVLNQVPAQRIVPWNALISAYEQNGLPRDALHAFCECLAHARPNEVTLVSALSACTQLGLLNMGSWIHTYTKQHGIKLDTHLTASLIDMYAKWGALSMAQEVFKSADCRDVFVWSAMIMALAMHGQAPAALDLFERMLDDNVAPNKVTFAKVLWACSHAGLVDEGRRYFDRMRGVFGIEPEAEHYGLMVDILNDAGLDEETRKLKEKQKTLAISHE